MFVSFEYISVFFVISGFVAAFIILTDISGLRAQTITKITWFLTGLWESWLGVYVYFKVIKPFQKKGHDDQEPLFPEKILLSTVYSGAGCVLANILSSFFLIELQPDTNFLPYLWGLNYLSALFIGIAFRYAVIFPNKDNPPMPREVIKKSVENDFLPLTVWQTGVSFYETIVFLKNDSIFYNHNWDFYFMLQIASFSGFLVTYPVKKNIFKWKEIPPFNLWRTIIKKSLKFILYTVAVLIIIGTTGLLFLDPLVKTGLNKYGSDILKTPFKVNHVSISLPKMQMTLNDLKIENPKGYTLPYLTDIKSIVIRLDGKTLLSDTTVIKNIDISGVRISYEMLGDKSNISELYKNMSSSKESVSEQLLHENEKEGVQKNKQQSKKDFIIQQLSITQAFTDVVLSNEFINAPIEFTLALPDMNLHDIGSKKDPVSMEQIGSYILDTISLNISDNVAKNNTSRTNNEPLNLNKILNSIFTP